MGLTGDEQGGRGELERALGPSWVVVKVVLTRSDGLLLPLLARGVLLKPAMS